MASSIQDYIFAGVQKMLEVELGTKPELTLTDDLEDVLRTVKAEDRDHLVALRPMSMDTATPPGTDGMGSARAASLFDRGIGGLRGDLTKANTTLGYTLVPTTFEFTFWYGTTSFKDLTEFFAKWSFIGKNARINFNLDYLSTNYAITSQLSSSLSIPPKPPRGTSGYQVYEGSIKTSGFLSNASDPRDQYEVRLLSATDFTMELS